jgi:hypothetical protein
MRSGRAILGLATDGAFVLALPHKGSRKTGLTVGHVPPAGIRLHLLQSIRMSQVLEELAQGRARQRYGCRTGTIRFTTKTPRPKQADCPRSAENRWRDRQSRQAMTLGMYAVSITAGCLRI